MMDREYWLGFCHGAGLVAIVSLIFLMLEIKLEERKKL